MTKLKELEAACKAAWEAAGKTWKTAYDKAGDLEAYDAAIAKYKVAYKACDVAEAALAAYEAREEAGEAYEAADKAAYAAYKAALAAWGDYKAPLAA